METLLMIIKYFCYLFTAIAIGLPAGCVLVAKWVDRQNQKHRAQADQDYDSWSV
jgi:hypothetical protein